MEGEKTMKRAVVLSGGGTKGAFELGVWKALNELSIEYDIVTGTSIGSINGALMCMKDYDRCENMWKSMTMTDMMNEPLEKKEVLREIIEKPPLPGDVMSGTLLSGAVDNSPFQSFVESHIDEDEMRRSDVDYGLVTVRLRDRKPFLLTKNDIEEGQICEYIIASSSVYPVFPMHMIGDDYYIDGMYYDNLPIDLAVSMGGTELIVVDLHTEPQHPNYLGRPYVTYITPSEDLGGILEFDPERIEKNINMGYRDAMRVFGKYEGYIYCFEKDTLKEFSASIEKFNALCAMGESAINNNMKGRIRREKNLYHMFHLLEQFSKGKEVRKEDYFIRGAEITAELCKLPHDRVWDMKDLVREAGYRLVSESSYPDMKLFTSADVNLKKGIKQLKKERGRLYLVGCMYYAYKNNKMDYGKMLSVLKLLPEELAATLFYLSVN